MSGGDIIGAIIVFGIAISALLSLVRFFENNAANWQRLDRIERMLEELTKKDEGEDEHKE